jgi:hypothetical protein
MRFTTERCLVCNSPSRPPYLKLGCRLAEAHTYDDLEDNSIVKETEFWFCSIECYEQEFRKLMPKKYDMDNKVEDDPDYTELWKDLYAEYHADFGQGFLKSLFSKYGHMNFEQMSQPRLDEFMKTWFKAQFQAMYVAQAQLSKRIRAEWDHHFYKETLKYVEEQEKLSEKLHQEVEKEQEEFEKQEAEEQRWKPRPFDV